MPSSGRNTPTTTMKLERSSSLTSFSEETEENAEATPKRQRKVRVGKAYRGRMSLGARTATLNLKGEQRRKSRQNKIIDDEIEYDYLPSTSTQNSQRLSTSDLLDSSTKRDGDNRLFNCLPVEENQEMISPSPSTRRMSVTSSSVAIDSSISEGTHAIGDVERKRLYNELYTLIERDTQASNLVVNQTKAKVKSEHIFSFTKDGKEERHKLGDYLWLVLKAYFAGKDVRGHFDPAMVYDPQICQLRSEKFVILPKILDFRLEHDYRESIHLTDLYLNSFVKQRERVIQILEEFDNFSSLFPHRKALENLCQQKGAQMEMIDERIDLLMAWLNTANQLCEKIEQFGQMLSVSQSTEGSRGWPRPFHGIAPANPESANQIVGSFVKEMLTVKGMKRVLVRVSNMCEELLLRATILLQQPAGSYARAAGTQRTLIPMTDFMREKYGDKVRGCLWNGRSIEMNLPSLLPLFIFVLGIRVQMVLEWLKIRVVDKLPDGAEMDLLTLKTFVEESRDCIEEAVRIKRDYLNRIAYTCQDAHDVLDPTYDQLLVDVFKNYRFFVSQLAAAFVQPNPCLFNNLEVQWTAAWTCAPFIDNGIEALTTSFCDILCSTMKKVVIDFWEDGVLKITEGIDDGSMESGGGSDGEGSAQGSLNEREIRRRRQLNMLVREAQERASRTFQVIKTMISSLMTSSCFVSMADDRTVARSLRDHVLINIMSTEERKTNPIDFPISLLSRPIDHGTLLHLINTVFESSSPDPPTYLIVLPISYSNFSSIWGGERATLSVSPKIVHNLLQLRRDRVVVIGDMCEPLHKRDPQVFRHCSKNSATHSHIHQLMVDFATRLNDFSQTVSEKVYDVITHRSFGESGSRRAAHSTLLTMFNFSFHFYREVCRIVWEVHELRIDFAERCVKLLERWRELVPMADPPRSQNIPVWAKIAFNFMLHIAELQWTQHMSDSVFERFRAVLDFSRREIIGGRDLGDMRAIRRTTSERDSGYISPRSAPQTQFDRAERLRAAAMKLDSDVEKRQVEKGILKVGLVVPNSRPKFTENGYQETRKVPFQWQLLEKIAEGNFGEVHKALNVDKGCVIAVKKIRARGAEKLKILEGEVDILRNLSHKNLVKYYGMEVQGDEVLLLMEYCAEGTLEKICREGMDMALVRRYTNHLLQAVEYIHDNRVIHRDIKPANIFLDLSCVLKLGDFGSSIRLSTNMTIGGEFHEMSGTPSYMAPETFTGGQVIALDENGAKTYRGYGRAVDIWSIGCVVLEMVTGRRPWDKCDMYQIALWLGNRKRPAYPNNCPPILRHFLDLCLDFDDRNRPNARAMLNDPFVNIHIDPQGTIERRLFM
ncbi:unnamed protein product, partial [Mesorhabditis belari]|uniref:Protein kinase domain-containing protein n=1 Tax=Mesorhabditis belari TaxID=2138241 RepID=A0AAF3F3Z5_9BILA